MLELAGKRATVMGLGRFGGGIGVTRWLAAQGADVLVTDLSGPDELKESVERIDDLVRSGGVSLRLGGHNVSDFTTCDVVIASPAVPRPWDNRFLRAAQAAKIPVTTEIGLVVERLPTRSRTVGVTGSVGKSTTTAMIAHALRETGHEVAVGGNIGGSLLEELAGVTAQTWVVLELSSFMLYWLDTLEYQDRERGMRAHGWSPHVAVVTNIAANHLDWHGTLEHYTHSKQTIVRHQHAVDKAVLGAGVASWRELARGRVKVVDPEGFSGALRVPGRHNVENAATALAACLACDAQTHAPGYERAIGSFPGLKHRLQLVAEKPLAGHEGEKAVRFYNDSKATTPEATLRAVEAVLETPGVSSASIHLIAGGYDKGSDLSAIGRLAATLGGLYTIGKTGPSLANAAPRAKATECETLGTAVGVAMERMRPGDVLLMSPGCASWDQYANYEERGEEFIRLVSERMGR